MKKINMSFSDFSRLVTRLDQLNRERDDYLAALPSELSSCVFDNTYQDLTARMLDAALEALFKDACNDVCIFLYEPRPYSVSVREEDGSSRHYEIDTIDDFLTFYAETMRFE